METPISRTALIKLIRRLAEYEQWKRAVFIRDRFQCQLCGARNGRKRVIEADHKQALSSLVKENKITTLAEALGCFALWDITNGRTLCHSCHEQTESYPVQLRRRKTKKKGRKKCVSY
ncbi:hypothetical protein GO755_29535 [Spirosoma sp. HMF4905]|uniref:HNH endonuclease n=1 Tax=Spirosoma arboris TaxID=2682092 RepID=A0A7K1SK85_9BACT|nr:hypothetical protein [Spirosoma arboris]MVM34210.1 hypothetical protein [Spirosoma arboris]